MKCPMHLLKLFVGKVRINLRGRNIGMPQKCLYGADVGAVLEQIGSKGMPQNVGSNFFCYAGFDGIFFYHSLN